MSVPGVAVAVVRLRPSADLPDLPRYMTPDAAGMDLQADIDAEILLAPGERRLVATGLALAIPPGFEGQVRPRSGLAHRHGLTLLNAPGTIDADYRGELQVLLVNLGQAPAHIRRGDRIAQLVVAPVARVAWHEVAALPPSARAAGGFGSTDRANGQNGERSRVRLRRARRGGSGGPSEERSPRSGRAPHGAPRR